FLPVPMTESMQHTVGLLQECLSAEPNHVEALWCLAAVRSVLGDRERLKDLADQMDRPGVKDARLHYLGAVCHLAKQDYARVVDAKERLEWKLEEPLRQTVLLAGLLAFKKGHYELAADRFREAGKLGLRDKRLGSMLTLALVKAGQRLLFEEVNGQ